jgi:DNA-directed RNA polymerase specialized sigma24 family protein
MATNTCLNRLRRQKLQGSSEKAQTLFTETFEHGSLDPQFEKVEDGLLIDIILQNESESMRAICFMYHIDNMNLREIGEVIGLSVSGVRKRLLAFKNRAKVKLEGELL